MVDGIEISRNFFTKLAAHGLSTDEVLTRAGVSAPAGEGVQIDTNQLFAIWKAVGELSSDPTIGLQIGKEFRAERLDPISIVAFSADTFHDALVKLARYKRLCGAEEMRMIEKRDLVRVELEWAFAAGPTPSLLLDSAFASIVEVGTRGTGQTIRPEAVERKTRDGAGVYEKHFGCVVRYGAAADALVFRRWQADLRMATRNPEVGGLIEPRLEAEWNERFGKSLSERVRALLGRRLAGSRPTLKEVASSLALSSRSFQRRLADEGVRFQDLLDTVRMDLSRRYLEESDLSLRQIASLVGYDEVNSFQRSFRAREAVTPGKWRQARRSGG